MRHSLYQREELVAKLAQAEAIVLGGTSYKFHNVALTAGYPFTVWLKRIEDGAIRAEVVANLIDGINEGVIQLISATKDENLEVSTL